MTQFDISLSGLNCGKCVNKLTQSLALLSDTELISIDKTSVSVNTSRPLLEIIADIERNKYQAGNHITLSLSGLRCGKCVGKVRDRLSTNTQIARFEVSKTSLSLVTTLDRNSVIGIVESLGFNATPETGEHLNPQQESEPETINIPDTTALTIPKTETKTFIQKTLISPQSNTFNLVLQGMTCASCVASVEKACLSVGGVQKAQINLAEQSAVISTDINDNIRDLLLKSIKDAGYSASIIEDEASQQAELQAAHIQAQTRHKKSATTALAVGAPLMLWGLLGGNMMIRNTSDQLVWGVIGVVCLVLLATAGRSFYTNAWQSLIHKRATMDTLVALGTGAAWFYSILVVVSPSWFPAASRHVYFEASAMIIGLISLGHYIEAKAKLRTTESLQSLIGLQVKTATVRQGDEDIVMPIGSITQGMLLLIKPGEKIPVDGNVVEGESYVDEAMLTGEPIPKLKVIGDNVSAGTINSDGSLFILATGVGNQTMLARIIQLVRQAQSSKPAIAKLADSISAIFVPVVVGIAIFSALIWWWVGPDPKASYMMIVSTTVLIIACPCALGLATPLSITVGIGKAAELGILIKDADVLQNASKIDTVVFDKTGTLTLGKPSIQEFEVLNGMDEEAFLQSIYALESHSEHPLAGAICQFSKEKNIPLNAATEVQNQRGKGLSGKVSGTTVSVGSVNFIRSQGIEIEDNHISSYLAKAWTVVAVSIDHQFAGIIAISDPIKKDALEAIALLQANKINVVLLSGDNQIVADKIAKEIGIKQVIAGVLPDEKAQHIQNLQSSGRIVAMVGDGINDAPALAQADIGIAMGSGSDVAIESAQMTLLNSSPIAVNSAIELSKATVRNMKQNLFGAFIYNSIGIPVAAGVLYPMFGFLLSPVFAGAAMALSSITVVSNANRLRFFKVK
ncbi:heavy metal translocating P-type ATPase [Vibrio sp. DW001]|uniref:heavy metal translocating P-type ATPase n=1 Tax=Vibrio sp. DW001 TaxID=2912315 RepID=UPI0023B010CB|nr:heavy metal translocating P-type ATPase [Vibrio sp. DW001]WED25966.1 heavy metal translocating P-type ATPase [Vibrio sp. DW001]